ncbi:MAG: hypothetical protein Q9196_001341 [Gyalolechia fulgens]
MSIKLLSSLLVLAWGISGEIITTTVSSSTVTATICTTLLGKSSTSSVPTRTNTKSLPAEVVVVLAVSTPVETVTPHEVTATDTVQVFTTTTVTDSTVTGVFSTTTTIYETESTTCTDTSIITSTSTETTTASTITVVPAPTGWMPITNSTGRTTNSTGRTTPPDGTIVDVQETLMQNTDLQQPLQDDASSSLLPDSYGPPGRLLSMRRRYVKMIIFVKSRHTTTTIRASTTTATSTETITSTSTIVPARVTETKSFSTTCTTTTTLTSSATVVSSTTELVTASTTITSYAACATDNILGPKVDKDLVIADVIDDRSNPLAPGTTEQMLLTDSAYDCCVTCFTSQNCQHSEYYSYNFCGLLLNPTVCLGQDVVAGKLVLESEEERPPEWGVAVSNGPCGKVV